MRRNILVAQTEPVGAPKFFDVRDGIPCFVYAPPACFGICKSRKGITNRIQVGTNIQPQMFKVIACVDDDSQVFWWEDLGESVRELRAADSARKGDYSTVDGGRWTMDGV